MGETVTIGGVTLHHGWIKDVLPGMPEASSGTVLDCFAGSGSTGKAALSEGLQSVLIEQDFDHFNYACARVAEAIMEAAC